MKRTFWIWGLLAGLVVAGHAATSSSGTGARGNTIFVGTIESVNVSNRTIEVSGAESYIATSNRTTNVRTTNRTTNPSTTKTRTLQTVGQTATRTFDVGGFCQIAIDEQDEGRMGKRKTVADLKVGDRVAVDFVKGIGDRYTAKFIQPLAALNVAAPKTTKTTTPKKKKN